MKSALIPIALAVLATLRPPSGHAARQSASPEPARPMVASSDGDQRWPASFALPQSQPPVGKKAGAADKNDAEPPTVKESAAMRQQARKVIKDGDLGQAEGLLRDGRRVKDLGEREEWLLVEAEYRLAKKQPAAAGLAAMRLVILRPDSERVGEAWYWTARAYDGLKRPYKAMELYRQCVEHKTTGGATRKLAKARLTKLEKQMGDR